MDSEASLADPESGEAPTTTRDALFGGRVVLTQPAKRHGYRVNVDALLLAAFVTGSLTPDRDRGRPFRHAVDLGAGVGAVGLALLHLGNIDRMTMIDVDPDLCALARRNAEDNGHDARVSVLCHDLSTPLPRDLTSADLVVCNPPYFVPGRGRTPGHPARARGRMGTLDIFVDAARRLAGRLARVCFVYPAPEAVTFFSTLRERGLEPKRVLFVHGKRSDAARVVLVSCVAGKAGGLVVEPPFVEMDDDGKSSPALAALLRGR